MILQCICITMSGEWQVTMSKVFLCTVCKVSVQRKPHVYTWACLLLQVCGCLFLQMWKDMKMCVWARWCVCVMAGVYPFGQALGMFNTVWKLLRQSVAVAVTQETVISALLTCLHQQHLPAVNHWLMAGLLPGGHRNRELSYKVPSKQQIHSYIYTQQVLPEKKIYTLLFKIWGQ